MSPSTQRSSTRHRAFPGRILAAVLLATLVASDLRADEPAWQPLFDGRTLTGWVRRGGEAQYRVETSPPDTATAGKKTDLDTSVTDLDASAIVGTAVLNTPNTFLCTEREFADFELEFDFKVDPRLNSGVQIRSASVPGHQRGVVHGYQVEIDPSPRAWTGGIYDESRRAKYLEDRQTPIDKNDAAHKAFKPNAWNHMRIACRGDSIKTWLNDVPVADVVDDLTHSGFIGLQVHSIAEKDLRGPDNREAKGADDNRAALPDKLEVRWRNLRIRDYGDPWRTPPAEAQATVLLGPKGDLSAWEHPAKSATQPASTVQWVWTADALEVKPGSGNIVTKQPFGDCRLHVEFNVDDNGQTGQANGNSGVYLQGRYEVQILNSAGQDPQNDICGAIYKVKSADYNMARPAGEWQTYDIWFHAPRWKKDADGKDQKTANARMTVYHNGTRVHHDVEIPDNTGAGNKEGPNDAPLLLQDHGNKVRFRNIWIAPLAGRWHYLSFDDVSVKYSEVGPSWLEEVLVSKHGVSQLRLADFAEGTRLDGFSYFGLQGQQRRLLMLTHEYATGEVWYYIRALYQSDDGSWKAEPVASLIYHRFTDFAGRLVIDVDNFLRIQEDPLSYSIVESAR